MPNGSDRNWVRLCGALEGFRALYGAWPSRLRVLPDVLGTFDWLFTPADLQKIRAKVDLVPDAQVGMVAEDAVGHTYRYAVDPWPPNRSDIRARDWLAVEPLLHPEADA